MTEQMDVLDPVLQYIGAPKVAQEKQLGAASWESSLGRAWEKLSARKTSNLVHFLRPLSSRTYIAQRTFKIRE